VIAQGRLKSRSYQTKEGENRTVMELEVDEIGPSLRYASAKVTRTTRQGGNGGGFGGGQQGDGNDWGNTSTSGEWGQPSNSPGGWGELPTQNDPPF